MKVVLQRVTQAGVTVDGEEVGAIGAGLVILLGVGRTDTTADVEYLAKKILTLRIFEDEAGKMNRSLIETDGQALIISQFTLLGDCRKGRRPSFVEAGQPEMARQLYQDFVTRIATMGVTTATGRFGAMMKVSLVNDGPVTFILDSRQT